jgi:competence protein ComEC
MLDDLLSAFNVRTIIDQPPSNETLECGNFTIRFFTPPHPFNDPNNLSLVFTIAFKHETILFTGDIESPVEPYYLDYRFEATMLKVAHHGSNTSTTDIFLDHVNPKTAIISAHKTNMFNHPSDDIVAKFSMRNIELYQTKEEGTITFSYYFGKRVKKDHKNP